MNSRRWTVVTLGLMAAAISTPDSVAARKDSAGLGEVRRATAEINGCSTGNAIGTADLIEAPSSEGIKNVTVLVSGRNLPPGDHAVHIHEVGACTPTCAAAGSHLDLGPFAHNVPVTANHPFHSGDLVNLNVKSNGRADMKHETSRIALSDGPLSIFDVDGASLVIHALPDKYCTDPSDPNCAGGGRIACGVIEPLQ